MLKKVLVICVFCFSTVLFAGIKADDISKVMEQKINEATSLVRENKSKGDLIAQKIYNIFDPIFDYALMARLSLGGKQFKSLSSSEQAVFIEEFTKSLKNSFKDSLSMYSDEKVVIGSLEDVKRRKVLKTKLVGSEKSYEVDYKFYDAKEKDWLIYDVMVADVSIIQSYRSQFSNILKDKGFNELISILKRAKLNIKK